MTILQLAWKNIWYRKLSLLLSLLLLALGVGIISMLLLIEKSITDKMENDLRGTDLVVGAKGSPMQLVLSAIYHTDAPTGNILLRDVQQLATNKLVKWWIPLSYGDTYMGSSIVGTTPQYIDLYKGQLAAGKLFDKEMEVVAGAAIAKKAKLKVGSSFVGQHGANGAAHEEHPYKVTGILAPTQTIIDHLLLTNIETVWEVHHHHHEEPAHAEDANHQAENSGKAAQKDARRDATSHPHGHDHEQDEHEQEANNDSLQITAALLKFHTPMAMMTMPRIINSNTNLQAANPAIEVRRLTKLLSIGTDTLKALGLGIMVVSALSIFIALFLRLKERSYELALMRSMGCPRRGLLWLLLGEGIGIAAAGAALGLLVSRVGVVLLQQSSAGAFNLVLSAGWLAQEGWLLLATLGIGALAALIPAVKAFQLNISKTLANEG